MLRDKPTILKLGGSVITRKEKPFTPNMKAITRLANEIASANVSSLVIVHGGGSFGHPVAKEYRIKNGYSHASQILGFSKTHLAMAELNKLVVDALIQHNIPAVEIAPSSCIITKQGRIDVMEEKPLQKMLKLGFTPVLYGDAVLDSKLGFTILSGDQLVASLAIRLNAKKIVVGVDVNGLYTADPKVNSSATLIQYLTLRELKAMQHKFETTMVTDVTGGMFGKVVELMRAVECGIPVVIVNAAKTNNIYKALKGETVTGTIILKK